MRGIAAFFGHESSQVSLAETDCENSLKTNEHLREQGPERKEEHRRHAIMLTKDRLKLLRSKLAISFLSMASACCTAVITSEIGLGIPTSVSVLAISSTFCFAWATLGRLGWAGQSFSGNTSVEILDRKLFHILYWVGMYLAVVAAY